MCRHLVGLSIRRLKVVAGRESIYAFWRSLYTVEYCVEGLRFHERLNLIVGPKENAAKGPS